MIRGPASVLYGSDALGGVINVVRRDLPDAIGRAPFAAGQVSAAYSTNNQQPDGTARLEGATGGLGFRTSLTGRTSDDFRTPLGPVFNTGNRAVAGDGSLGYRGGWGSVRADCHLPRREAGVPRRRNGDAAPADRRHARRRHRQSPDRGLPPGGDHRVRAKPAPGVRGRGADEVASGLLANELQGRRAVSPRAARPAQRPRRGSDVLRRLHRVRRGPAPDPEQPGPERRGLRLRTARAEPVDAVLRRPLRLPPPGRDRRPGAARRHGHARPDPRPTTRSSGTSARCFT